MQNPWIAEFRRAAHWQCFSRRCAALGRTPAEDMAVILKRLKLIYPVCA